jgi:hypothetical protein
MANSKIFWPQSSGFAAPEQRPTISSIINKFIISFEGLERQTVLEEQAQASKATTPSKATYSYLSKYPYPSAFSQYR